MPKRPWLSLLDKITVAARLGNWCRELRCLPVMKDRTHSIRRLAPVVLCLVAGGAYAQNGNITGQVFCSDTQKPARFAHVKITNAYSLGKNLTAGGPLFQRRRGGDHNETYTLADGTFTIKDVPPGVYDLEIVYNGYIDPVVWLASDKEEDRANAQSLLSLVTQVTVQEGFTVNKIATIYRDAELSGTVTYDDGSPAPNVVVEPMYGVPAAAPDAASQTAATIKLLRLPLYFQAVTDGNGRFLVHGLVSGTYVLKASPKEVSSTSYFPTYLGNTIEQSQATLENARSGTERSGLDIQINVSNLHLVRGALMTADNRPIANENVGLKLISDKEFGAHTTTAADGSFSFSDIPDGHFKLTADAGTDADSSPPHKSVTVPVTVHGFDITDLILTPAP
jgi:hypothetical protein